MSCIRPKFITVRNDWRGRLLGRYAFDRLPVPCGKCAECVKRKQNIAVVANYMQAKISSSCHFFTFTYNDDNIPVMRSTHIYDPETGDCLYRKCDNEYISSKGFQHLWKDEKHRHTCVGSHNYIDADGNLRVVDLSLSLRRKDVSKVIHVFRERYRRKTGKVHPLKYFSIGEYGPRTGRPHYHVLCYNLTDVEAYELKDIWSNRFGFCDMKRCDISIPEKALAVGKYVGKYMSKGVFENECVNRGTVQKPRKCASPNFGDVNGFAAKHRDWFLAKDLFGNYNYNTLSDANKNLLKSIITSRMYFSINGWHYPLPDTIKTRVYKYKNSNGQVLSLPVLKSIADDSFQRIYQSSLREFQGYSSQHPHLCGDALSASYQAWASGCDHFKSVCYEKDLRNFYAKSVF